MSGWQKTKQPVVYPHSLEHRRLLFFLVIWAENGGFPWRVTICVCLSLLMWDPLWESCRRKEDTVHHMPRVYKPWIPFLLLPPTPHFCLLGEFYTVTSREESRMQFPPSGLALGVLTLPNDLLSLHLLQRHQPFNSSFPGASCLVPLSLSLQLHSWKSFGASWAWAENFGPHSVSAVILSGTQTAQRSQGSLPLGCLQQPLSLCACAHVYVCTCVCVVSWVQGLALQHCVSFKTPWF